MAVVAMGCAVILSGSRGGLLVMVAQFLLFAGWATRQRGGRRAFLAFAVTLLVIVGAAVAVGGTQIFDRAFNLIQPSPAELDDAAGYRIEAAKGTFELFRRNWLLGGGLESFSRLFPAVRSFATDKYWNYAHNDILQFLAELGIIGGVLAAAMLVVGGASAFRNLREHAGGANGPLLAGLACAVIGFLMHGALDFNFHVPANAASFGVLAALLARRGWKEE
jgi:O-antigen ligase